MLEWSSQQVCHWLLAAGLDRYAKEFMSKGIDGQQLLQLDGAKLKVRTVLCDRQCCVCHLITLHIQYSQIHTRCNCHKVTLSMFLPQSHTIDVLATKSLSMVLSQSHFSCSLHKVALRIVTDAGCKQRQ